MTEERFRKAFLLILVVAITAAFVVMLRPFLLTILLAAIFAGLAYPLYQRLTEVLKGHRPLASALTLLLGLVLVVAPLILILSIVVNQAIMVTADVQPVVRRLINEPTYFGQLLEGLPGFERLMPYREQILTRAGDVVDTIGAFLVSSLTEVTRLTVAFVLHFFILLYTMFFLLMDGPKLKQAMLNYLPLREDDKQQVTARFLSVTRATIKGTLVIGIIQGTMAGLAFAVAGIPNAVFWTVVMIVLSILPLIGAALVWVPAAVILIARGDMVAGIVLAAFCALVVGSVDNVLRPRLVGRDTKMHDLMILFSTLGGILVFGPIGFIVGPILAGLFVTSWEIFGLAYRDVLTPAPLVAAPGYPPEPAAEAEALARVRDRG